MDRRQFGSSGLFTSALGMGCSRLGSFLSVGGTKEALATIRLAMDQGITYFDTADIYGQGDSERLLGTAIRGARDRVLLATKAGRRFSRRARLAARIKSPIKLAIKLVPALGNRLQRARAEQLSLDFTPEYLTAALEESLKRLRTDRVDVFMLHSPPAEVLENEELFHRLSRLREEGKVRCLGVSVAECAHAALAARLPGIQAIQMPIGRPHRDANSSLLPALARQGIAVVGREVFEGVPKPIDAGTLRAVLHESMGNPGVTVVLVGMSMREHLRANVFALSQ